MKVDRHCRHCTKLASSRALGSGAAFLIHMSYGAGAKGASGENGDFRFETLETTPRVLNEENQIFDKFLAAFEAPQNAQTHEYSDFGCNVIRNLSCLLTPRARVSIDDS